MLVRKTSQGILCQGEGFGRRLLEGHFLARERVMEAQQGGVKHGMVGHLFKGFGEVAVAIVSIKRIANNGMTNVSGVNANLVGASGQNVEIDAAGFGKGFHHFEARF